MPQKVETGNKCSMLSLFNKDIYRRHLWTLGSANQNTQQHEKKTTLFRPPAGRPAPALANLRLLRRRSKWTETVLQDCKW